MNLPIDNLFYISGFSNKRDLYNLIGRVNRLNEIFSIKNKKLSKIFIPVHFLEIGKYPQNRNSQLKTKVLSLRTTFEDSPKNPLLENAEISSNNIDNAEKIISAEQNIIKSYSNPNFLEKLSIAGAQQILNFTDQGLMKLEKKFSTLNASDELELLDLIKSVFFDGFERDIDYRPAPNTARLKSNETVQYYKMFVNDLQTKSLFDRVNKTVLLQSLKLKNTISDQPSI